MNNSKNKYQGMTLLAVLAHPDDETFGMGGTLSPASRVIRGASLEQMLGPDWAELLDETPDVVERPDAVKVSGRAKGEIVFHNVAFLVPLD